MVLQIVLRTMEFSEDKFYGRGTTKLFQVRLRPEEFDEIVAFVKDQGITRRNFQMRYLGIAKRIMSTTRVKRPMAGQNGFTERYKKLKGRR